MHGKTRTECPMRETDIVGGNDQIPWLEQVPAKGGMDSRSLKF